MAPDDAALDEDRLGRLALAAWKTREGALVNLMLYLGDRLGLFAELPVGEGFGAAEVAARTGCDERWLLEWLRCLAAAGFLESSEGERFECSPEAAVVLAAADHPSFVGGAMQAPPAPDHVDAVADAMRSGRGFTYGDLGVDMARSIEAGFAPRERALLVAEVVPAIGGLAERLAAGARVVEVGCGTGHTISVLADAFGAARFTGYDPSEPATAIARARFADDDRISVVTAGAEDLPDEAAFDVALAFDCLHDMPRPDLALAAVARALTPDGVLVIKEIRSTGDFDHDRKNPVHAMMYASSVTTCLASATSTPDGLGLGTLGLHPDRLTEMCRQAGFSSVVTHDVGDPVNLYYEVRR